MAQTGYTPISLYYSTTASTAPTAGNLVAGELAINTTDGKLYYKDTAGVVQVIGTKGGVGSSTTTQVLYNSSGLVVGSANMTFSGTALTLANDASISGLTVGKGGAGGAANTAFGNTAIPIAPNSGVTALGNHAGAVFNTASDTGQSTFVGYYAGAQVSTGTDNTFVGGSVGTNTTTGAKNTALGSQALQLNTTASNNTAVGYQAAYANTTGTALVALGYGTLAGNTTGSNNIAVGLNALVANTTASDNSALGHYALAANTTGASNTAMGSQALRLNTTASNNTAVGYQAGYANTGAQNTYIGRLAGYSKTSGDYNTFIGDETGYNQTTGQGNTYVGSGPVYAAGANMTTGSKNTILGAYSGNNGGLDIRTASNYIVLSDGDGNPRGIFDGSGNYLINGTTVYGKQTNFHNSSYVYASVSVGNGADHIIFKNDSTTVGSINRVAGTGVIYNTTSDYRLKENVVPMTGALNKILELKPVTYTWKIDGSKGQGFIAHELQEVIPDAVSGEKDAVEEDGLIKPQGIDQSRIVATLTAAIQELNAKVTALETQLQGK